MDNTEKYIDNHKRVFALKNKRNKNHTVKPKYLAGGSIYALVKYHLKSIVRTLIYYPSALINFRKFFFKVWKMKGIAKNRKAIVFGNGPSQSYVTQKELDDFVKMGGETICVNNWHQNEELANHIPTWLVFSDPLSFDINEPNALNLINYLKNNSSIKVLIPTSQIKLIKKIGLKNEIYCFVDIELSIWKNLNPFLPRGYMSITLYKALAWSVYLGYNSIGILGMDNTLPRNIYNNDQNKVHLLESYAGVEDCLVDVSNYHSTVASYYFDVFKIFHHLEHFPKKNIFNLDPYSLTDRFKKISKNSFFEV